MTKTNRVHVLDLLLLMLALWLLVVAAQGIQKDPRPPSPFEITVAGLLFSGLLLISHRQKIGSAVAMIGAVVLFIKILHSDPTPIETVTVALVVILIVLMPKPPRPRPTAVSQPARQLVQYNPN